MKLKFIGTRGEIEARTPLHSQHTALLITHDRQRIMIDCGADWLGQLDAVRPDAIVVTHAHPDHAWGLRNGAPCPVFAPEQTWRTLEFPFHGKKQVLTLRKKMQFHGLEVEAFPVEHSIRCPSVGYRISAPGAAFFYCPDVVYIPDRAEAFAGIQLYIGDAATVTQSFVRRRGGALIGHAPIRTQLGWCEKEKVARAIFTHCGPEVVEGDAKQLARTIGALGAQRGVQAEIAIDGQEVRFPGKRKTL